MTLIPHKHQTLILPIPAEVALSRLIAVTQPARLVQPSSADKHILFHGKIGFSSFRISRKINYSQNYLPIIKGRIEATSLGCIIFLKYSLFFGSLIFFIFWTTMAVLIGLFFFLYLQEYSYACIALASGAANYIVTVLNFNTQVRKSREALEEALKISA